MSGFRVLTRVVLGAQIFDKYWYGSCWDMSDMPLVGLLPIGMLEWLVPANEHMKEKNWPADLPEIEGVVDRIETIQGVDGNEIKLHIS